ncbi:MAG: ferrochelatase [Rickettsiaceae bacterium]
MSKASENKKVAIVLFNLGGPDSLKAVKPFLFNLFNDKYIITLPSFFRYIVAWLISSRREKTAKAIYARMGGKSTILAETEKQAKALKAYLEGKLSVEHEVFICMRHWHPMSPEVVKQIEHYKPDEIILLPLYPQFSTTTTGSSIEDFIAKKEKSSVIKDATLKTICCYPVDSNFIKSHVELIKKEIDKIRGPKKYRLLFSAHGLPKKIINSGDSYQWQVEASVNAVVSQLQLTELDYKLTYQSRVGPLEWLGPNTEDEITLAAKQGLDLVIVPIAFVSEHSETIIELDIEYKEIADKYGISYYRVPTLSINEPFIKSLGEIVTKSVEKKGEFLLSSKFSRICPGIFSKCPCENQ